MNSRQSLSVVLAVRNEEQFLSDCLKSVQGLADEIIICDEYSTDKTREIAHAYKAKVFKVKHQAIFHINKNKAINKASKDWVLQLDADERLTKELFQEIEALLDGKKFGFDSWQSPIKQTLSQFIPALKKPRALNQAAAAYWLVRKNYFLGRYLKNTGQYPDPVIRLFQRGKAILPAKNVHEQMIVKGQVGWLGSDLDHYATPNFARYLKREDYYSTLESDFMYRSKIKVNLLNTLNYLFFKPLITFLKLFLRYRGFLDGFPGFVFSLYSGLHFAFAYMKLWEKYEQKKSN